MAVGPRVVDNVLRGSYRSQIDGVHALPTPGPSTESEHEMMDVLPSSPVSPTNRVGQSMGWTSHQENGENGKYLLASDQPAKPNKGPFCYSVTLTDSLHNDSGATSSRSSERSHCAPGPVPTSNPNEIH